MRLFSCRIGNVEIIKKKMRVLRLEVILRRKIMKLVIEFRILFFIFRYKF